MSDLHDDTPPVDPPIDDTPPVDPPEPIDDDPPPADPPIDDDPKGFTKAINRKHWELEEQRRENAALQAQLDAQAAAQPTARPEVPAVPDAYDENFTDLMVVRDEAINAQASFDAQQQAAQQIQQRDAQQAQHQQAQLYTERVTTYAGRAEKLGVSAQELQVAGMAVAAGGISPELTDHILADEKGPLITSYLAKNPAELEAMRGMSTIQAGIHLATHITPKAAAAGGISGAPPPVDGLGGGGAPPTKRGPKGATYE